MEFPFKNDWILPKLNSIEEFRESKGSAEIQVRPIGENGFLANVYLVTVDLSDGKRLEVVIKLCGQILQASEALSSTDDFLATIHKRECVFYAWFGAIPLPIPKVYSFAEATPGKVPGFVMMESLLGRGETFHFSQGLSLAQLLELARFVARMQAFSLNLKDKSWLVEFEKPNFDMILQNEYIVKTYQRLKALRNGALKSEAETLETHVKQDFMTLSQYQIHKQLGIPSVLCHGDLWTHNVLWNVEGNGIECVFDFQGAHAGNPAWDLARLLVLCTDVEERTCHWEQIFEEYYNTLKSLVSGTVPFSLEQVKRLYEYTFVNQAVQFGCSLVNEHEQLQVAKAEERALSQERFEKVYKRAESTLREAAENVEKMKLV